MRPPRMEYPAAGSPAPSRLPPRMGAASRIEMFPPGTLPSRIMKAAAARDPMPPPTRYFRAEPRRAVCLLQAESCPGEGVGELVTGVNSLCNDPASFPAIQVGEEAAPLLTR